ncbi:MAG: hypothetical protein AAF193_10115, partial [Bacteroidota bacterium]
MSTFLQHRYSKIIAITAVISLLLAILQFKSNQVESIKGEWSMNVVVEGAQLEKYIGAEITWTILLT